MKLLTLKTLTLGTLLITSHAFADMGGGRYNQGNYTCQDQTTGLSGTFTFGGEQANLDIKGQALTLDCVPAQQTDMNALRFLNQNYLGNAADACQGRSEKGEILVATVNSMGIISMRAFLFDSAGQVSARATLGCKPVQKEAGSGW